MCERTTDFPEKIDSNHDKTPGVSIGCGACDQCDRIDLPFDIKEAAACIRLRDLAEVTAALDGPAG